MIAGRGFRRVLLAASLCSCFASGATMPPPFQPLWPERLDDGERDTGSGAVATGIEREVVLDGGSDPMVRMSTDRWISAVRLDRRHWSARAEFGMSDGIAELSAGRWRTRWIPEDEHRLGVTMIGRAGWFQGGLVFQKDGGTTRATVSSRLGIGSLAMDGEWSRRLERGAVSLAYDQQSPLAFAWSASGWDAAGGLALDVVDRGRLHGRVLRSESHPDPVEGRYRLETRVTSSGWSTGWEPNGAGPWIALDARHVEMRSSGWSDTLGSDRKFHDFLLRASWRSTAAGWIQGGWRFGVHGEEREFDAPRTSFFSPFLSWNVLDPSVWSPIDQILSDQREHVSGTAEYRAFGAGASWRRRGRRLDAGLSGDLSWRALDIHLLHRSTRMEMLGMGWSLETDSVGAPRLRLVLLSLGSDVALHLGRYGDLSGRGRIGIPLRIVRLRRDGRAAPSGSDAGGGGDGDDAQGLWSAGVGWCRAW